MNQFAPWIRFTVLVVVAVACGLMTRWIPSPYEEHASRKPAQVEKASAPEAREANLRKSKPRYQGVDVDQMALALASTIS
jgi:hypothetical protein